MLSTEVIKQLALRLQESRDRRSPIRPLSKEFPDMTVEDAYAVQRAWVHLEQSRGRVIRGYKVGLTTPAMQKAFRADGPACGPLFDEMILSAGEPTRAERFIAPRVEVELAFVLGRSLPGSSIEIQDVLEATAYVSPAFEIIDTRIEQLVRDAREPLIDIVSDFGAAAGAVLGAGRFKADEHDLSQCIATLYMNGVARESGTSAAVLGHPARSVLWLARQLALRGLSLEKDSIVLSGSLTKPVEIRAGDSVRADYGALGTVEFRLI
jgi:2-oxo-hept-3-ene-1,7-dioate hydratase